MSAKQLHEDVGPSRMMRGLVHVRDTRDVEIGSINVKEHIISLARERAIDPDVFGTREPYAWIAESSSNVIDFYGTRMTPGTLDNFQQNLKDGIGFMQSHSTKDFVGRSVDGWQVQEQKDDRDNLLIGGFYTVRGLKLGAIDTDSFIDGMRSGIISDVSVGFFSDDVRCSICGKQIFDWWNYYIDPENYCPHVPLEEYEKVDEDGRPILDANGDPVMEMAIGDVYDGMLAEVSGVYDGAAPGAQVLKAEAFARQGKLSEQSIRRLEKRYRMRLPESEAKNTFRVSVPAQDFGRIIDSSGYGYGTIGNTVSVSSNTTTHGGSTVTEQTISAALRESLKERGVKGDLVSLNEDLIARILTGWDDDKDKIEALQVDADMGVQYKNDLVEDALKAGVRAKGQDFKADRYETILRSLDIDSIKDMRDDWQLEGDHRLAGSGEEPAGGRKTIEGGDPIRLSDRKSSRDDMAHLG